MNERENQEKIKKRKRETVKARRRINEKKQENRTKRQEADK